MAAQPRRRVRWGSSHSAGARPGTLRHLSFSIPVLLRRLLADGSVRAIALVTALAAGRLVGPRTASEPAEAAALYERASRAYTEQRYADAAEYVRSALVHGAPPELKPELLCVRGESLLRAERPREAAEAFEMVTRDFPGSPHEAQALFGMSRPGMRGEAEAAAPCETVLAEFPNTLGFALEGRAP